MERCFPTPPHYQPRPAPPRPTPRRCLQSQSTFLKGARGPVSSVSPCVSDVNSEPIRRPALPRPALPYHLLSLFAHDTDVQYVSVRVNSLFFSSKEGKPGIRRSVLAAGCHTEFHGIPWQAELREGERQGRTGERASEMESYGVSVSAREMQGRGSRLSVPLALTHTP